MRTLAAAISTGLLALIVAGTASAVPTVSLLWITTTGTGATGGSTINAASGDVLTLSIDVTDTSTTFASVGLSLLGGVTYTGPTSPTVAGVECPSPPNLAAGFCGSAFLGAGGAGSGVEVGPTGTGPGLCPTGSVCAWDAGPGAAGATGTFRLGNAVFTVGATSATISTFYRAGVDSILSGTVPFTPSASAAINVPAAVPEPGTLGLLALGLGALTVAGRSRKA